MLEGAVLDRTTDDLNKALLAIHNQINKKYSGKIALITLKKKNLLAFVFRRSSCDMPGHILCELRFNSYICEC